MGRSVKPSLAAEDLVLVREFDSVEQTLLYERNGHGATSILLGMLRAAVLLSETVLLTDSMLLDGLFFFVLGPRDVAAALGVSPHELPIRVLARTGSLLDTLRAQETEPTWRELAERGFLGHGEADLLEVGRRRDEWARSAARGDFAVGRYGTAPFELRFGEADRFLSTLHEPARAAALAILEERGRLRAFSHLDQARTQAGVALTPDFERVRSWWNEAYLRAIAAQHGAHWIRMTTECDPDGSAVPGDAPRTVSGRLLETLRTMPPPAFGTVLYATDDERRRFRRVGTQRALNGLAFAVRSALPGPSRRSAVVLGVVWRLVISAVVIVLSLLPKGPDLEVTVVAVVVLLLTTVPWSELWRLRDVARRNHEATITLSSPR